MADVSLKRLREIANLINPGPSAPVDRSEAIAAAEHQFGRHVVAFIGHEKPWEAIGHVAIQTFRPENCCVYFIGGDAGLIKIGLSIAPLERLASMQMGSPIRLRILALTSGGASVEREYHLRFTAHRSHGEWFNPHPVIFAEIERLASAPVHACG